LKRIDTNNNMRVLLAGTKIGAERILNALDWPVDVDLKTGFGFEESTRTAILNRPELIIAQHRGQRFDAIEFAGAAQKRSPRPAIILVIRPDDLNLALEKGRFRGGPAVVLVPEPFDADNFLQTISESLKRIRQLRETSFSTKTNSLEFQNLDREKLTRIRIPAVADEPVLDQLRMDLQTRLGQHEGILKSVLFDLSELRLIDTHVLEFLREAGSRLRGRGHTPVERTGEAPFVSKLFDVCGIGIPSTLKEPPKAEF
jgi:hypothetical protein